MPGSGQAPSGERVITPMEYTHISFVSLLLFCKQVIGTMQNIKVHSLEYKMGSTHTLQAAAPLSNYLKLSQNIKHLLSACMYASLEPVKPKILSLFACSYTKRSYSRERMK